MNLLSRISVLLFALALAGCSSGVREDRTIEFSSSGSTVGFQHGNAGVFLSDVQTGSSQHIYSLQDGEIVASSPQFAADDSVIFAVASLESDSEYAGDNRSWDAASQGRRFFAAPTKYKCLHRTHGDSTELLTLFEARCDHTGYVAANLAVRWHPNRQSIWYIDKVDDNVLALHEYTLSDKSTRRVTPFDASALAFEFSPSGKYVACASFASDGGNSVVRLMTTSDDAWKELPLSALAGDPTADWLEQLRQALPHFVQDDSHCVYEARQEQTIQGDNGEVLWTTHLVHYEPNASSAETLWITTGDVRDIHWHPDGDQLAFVDETNQLNCVSSSSILATKTDGTTKASTLLPLQNVRRFAGFSADGKWISFTKAEQHFLPKSTYLFNHVDQARDQLFATRYNPNGNSSATSDRPLIEGMRLTFPHWSQEHNQLSLWATYAPSHASRLSALLPWSLGAGDPAAIISAEERTIKWLPINPVEEAQVGNYYLLHRDEETAWEWYAKSIDQRKFMQPIQLSQWQLFQQQTLQLQDSTFFEFVCLSRLGRHTEANERLELFDKHFVLDQEDARLQIFPESANETDIARTTELTQEVSAAIIPVLKASYITEVYLSLDAADEGIAFFEKQESKTDAPWQHFAKRLCLAHLILATDARDQYAEFVVSELIPAFEALNHPGMSVAGTSIQASSDSIAPLQQAFLRIATGLAVAPLMSQELTESLTPATLNLLETKIDSMLQTTRETVETSTLKRILLAINESQVDSRAEQLRSELSSEEEEPLSRFVLSLGADEKESLWTPAK